MFSLNPLVRSPQEPVNNTLFFELSSISVGILILLAETVQYWRILQRIKKDDFHNIGFGSLVMIVAIILLLINLFAFIAFLS